MIIIISIHLHCLWFRRHQAEYCFILSGPPNILLVNKTTLILMSLIPEAIKLKSLVAPTEWGGDILCGETITTPDSVLYLTGGCS